MSSNPKNNANLLASANLGTSCPHGEFVDTTILCPVGTNNDIGAFNDSLRLELEEVVEIVNDTSTVGTGLVRHGRKQHTVLGVSVGDNGRIARGQGVIPQVEKILYLLLGNVFANGNSFGPVVVYDKASDRKVRQVAMGFVTWPGKQVPIRRVEDSRMNVHHRLSVEQ